MKSLSGCHGYIYNYFDLSLEKEESSKEQCVCFCYNLSQNPVFASGSYKNIFIHDIWRSVYPDGGSSTWPPTGTHKSGVVWLSYKAAVDAQETDAWPDQKAELCLLLTPSHFTTKTYSEDFIRGDSCMYCFSNAAFSVKIHHDCNCSQTSLQKNLV